MESVGQLLRLSGHLYVAFCRMGYTANAMGFGLAGSRDV